MLAIIELGTTVAIQQEGRLMHNALQSEHFIRQMQREGTRIMMVRADNGRTVANLAVDDNIITNIVGPYNAPVSELTRQDIRIAARDMGITLPSGLEFGGPRMMG